MYTNLRTHIHKLFSRFIIKAYLFARRMNLKHIFPALELLARKIDLPQPNGVTVNAIDPNEGPLYVIGRSPTAAGDIAKTYERSGDFPNIYPGTLPLDGSWGTFEDNQGDTYSIHPLVATELTLEQRWDFYQSTAPDPDPDGQDPSVDQVGPLMRRSVFDLGGDFDHDGNLDHNFDEDTTFFTFGPVDPT